MKGFIYTLEVLVAIGLITVAAVTMFRNAPNEVDTTTSTLKTQGYNALRYLDDTGLLRAYVDRNDETLIESYLSGILPSTSGFEAEICRLLCQDTGVPDNTDVASLDYFISGYRSIYLENRVKLWIWKK